jgi:hypothetical protein
LADDVFVEFGDDLTGRQVLHEGILAVPAGPHELRRHLKCLTT